MHCIDIKMEKGNAVLRYKSTIEKMRALLRLMEACIFVFMISSHLPLAFKVCADCIRFLYITIFSPAFLFILGNAIVLVLFVKSGHLSAQETKYFEFCNKYVESGYENKINYKIEEAVEKQGKDGKCEAVLDLCSFEKRRKMVRSESMRHHQHRDSSDAAVIIQDNNRVSPQNFTPKCYPEDEMSGEEFRHAVEAFIARQQRSLREQEEEEEFSSIVTYANYYSAKGEPHFSS